MTTHEKGTGLMEQVQQRISAFGFADIFAMVGIVGITAVGIWVGEIQTRLENKADKVDIVRIDTQLTAIASDTSKMSHQMDRILDSQRSLYEGMLRNNEQTSKPGER